MKRHFKLEEICFDEYNEICRELELPHDTSSYSTNKRYWCGFPKRYAKLTERITYRRLAGIIQDIDDEHLAKGEQRIRQIFTSPGLFRFSEGKRILKTEPAFYFEQLLKHEHIINELFISLAKKRNGDSFYSDSFTYKKEDDLWVLRKVVVHKPNYEFYIFKGMKESDLEGYYSLKCVLPR